MFFTSLVEFKHLLAVLEIIFLYSQDMCPFKSSFWSDILQIKPDKIYWMTTNWRREMFGHHVQFGNVDITMELAGHSRNLVEQCPVTNCYFQHWLDLHFYILHNYIFYFFIQLSIPHQWLEGNLPPSAKCSVCDQICGSKRRLQGFRCLWCNLMVC